MFFLRFAYFNLIYLFVSVISLVLLYRLRFYKYPVYSYSLTNFIKSKGFSYKTYPRKILFFLRFFLLVSLAFLVMRPQWVDSRSRINVEGVDIILTLDLSGSMQVFDDLHDQRSRVDVEKTEAIRFIEKRTDDPIGIVIFGKDAVTRCPLTLDKQMLKSIVGELKLGIIDSNGTALGTAIATSVNRLRKSKAKSKVIILLTDGVPTEEKVDPNTAITLAKQYGVKVYTIGIGNKNGGYIKHPFLGVQQAGTPIDMNLLQEIANQTGGYAFRANNPRQLYQIYNKIDSLEKTDYETNIFNKYYEAFLNFIWIVLLLLLAELILRFFIWRGI